MADLVVDWRTCVDNELQVRISDAITEHNPSVINGIVTLVWYLAGILEGDEEEISRYAELLTRMGTVIREFRATQNIHEPNESVN